MKLLRFLPGLLILFGSESAFGGKLDLAYGYFNITAKTAKKSGSLDYAGLIRAGYRHPLLSSLEGMIGYTFMFSSFASGDMGFGLDFGLNYYPLTECAPSKIETEDRKFEVTELWRPYLGVSFHQRQFQSVQTGYVGAGILGGVERTLNKYLSVRGELRWVELSGGATSTATEITGALGMVLTY